MGCRSIEIDIQYRNNKFYVAHGNIQISTTNKYLLEDALYQVVKFSKTTSDPIIIMFEITVPDETRPALSKLIKTCLSDKLLDDKYKFKNNKTSGYSTTGDYWYYQNDNGIVIDTLPLSTFLNKIIILTSSSPRKLEDVLDSSYFYNQADDKAIDNYRNSYNNYGDFLKRVYPSPNITTIYSYNYNPLPWWKGGYNMVALNMQGTDYYQYLNTLKFKTIILFMFYSSSGVPSSLLSFLSLEKSSSSSSISSKSKSYITKNLITSL
jgi:hypothetical protein